MVFSKRNPTFNGKGIYEVEFRGKNYVVSTEEPDFHMDYRDTTFRVRQHATFCVLSKEPVLMPNAKSKEDMGYLSLPIHRLRYHNTIPVYVVQKKKIHYTQKDGTPFVKYVYIYDLIKGEKCKVIRKLGKTA